MKISNGKFTKRTVRKEIPAEHRSMPDKRKIEELLEKSSERLLKPSYYMENVLFHYLATGWIFLIG